MTTSQPQQRAASLVNSFTELNQVAADGVRTIVSGHGIYVRDADDREYLDAISGLWSTSLGFSQPELVAAALEQLGRLPSYHIAADKATGPALELCERLRQLGPGQVARVLLANSGSEANDTQIKLLRYYWHAAGEPRRSRFIARHGAFHGSTLGAGSLSDQGASSAAFGLPVIEVSRITAPCMAWHAEPGETAAQFVGRLADELESTIQTGGPETVAGLFLEPVMGAGGVVVPPLGYYDAVSAVAARYGVRIVADEVITGLGRLGAMWGCDLYGLAPNSTSVAKGLSGGYAPAAAVLVDLAMAEAMAAQSHALGTFAHGFTTGGHPVTAAVALRTLELLEEGGIVASAARVGAFLQAELGRLAELDTVVDVRGVGLLAGVELGGPDPAGLVRAVVARAAAGGLIVRGIGRTICLCPPLILTDDEAALIVARLRTAITEAVALR
ncbi:MAG: aminotransferase class III-fold pyridoxal phosphate-dependent enzyme [Micromonosporaceae bacterium]